MNGHTNGGQKKNRGYRTIKVAPTTRAIRAALAVSATMLALSGSGAAFAGTCAVTALNEVTCNGVFTDSVDNSVPVINLVPDLTLVIGDDMSTTVDPAAGVTGLTSTWGGDATVITYADITTTGADGIYMYSDETATLSNYGSIYTSVTGADQSGVDISAYGDVTVVNGGDITATSGGAYSVIALDASSSDGAVSIDNQVGGSIEADSYSGVAIGIHVGYAYDGATVNNDGDISVSSFTNVAVGIQAGGEGYIEVTNGGTIEAYSLNGLSAGISTFTVDGDTAVTNDGGIYVGGAGYAEGIGATSLYGTATITNNGTLEATSYLGAAVGANAYGKYADVDNTGDVTVNGYTGANGIFAYGIDGVNVSNTGDITANAVGIGGYAAGISAVGSGYINLYNDGNISVTSSGDGGGAPLLPYSAGADGVGMSAVSIYSAGSDTLLSGPGDINAVNGPGGDIFVDVAGDGTGMNGVTVGTGSVYMDNQGTVEVYAGGDATGMNGYSNSGTLEVHNSGSVYAYGYNGNAYGMNLVTQVYEGDITVDNSGDVTVYSYNANGSGIWAASTGDYSDVSVDNSGSIDSSSYNGNANGITLIALGYSSDVSVTSSGSIDTTTQYGDARGIYAVARGDYGDATVTLSDTSTVNAYSYDGDAIGAIMGSTGNYSVVTFDNAGSIDAESYNGNAVGFESISQGDYSEVYAYNSGTVTANSTYGAAVGAVAEALGIQTDLRFDNSGSIGVNGYDTAFAVEAVTFGDSSTIDLSNSGSIVAAALNGTSFGVISETFGYESYLSIDNSGSIDSSSTYDSAIGIFAITFGDYADVSVDDSGSVSAYAYGPALGVYARAFGYQADVTVNNGGSVTATSLDDEAVGIGVSNDADAGGIYVTSDGSIAAYAYGEAFGVEARGYGYGDTNVDNGGDIYAYSSDDEATGIYARAAQGNVYVSNAGSIEAYSYDEAYGIDTYSYGAGIISVTSSGSIDVSSSAEQAEGINAIGHGAGNVYVDNSGSINVYAYGVSSGIYAYSALASVYVYNSGDIYASSYFDYATGIDAQSPTGNAYVNSSGGSVEAYTVYGVATGINAYAAAGDATVFNDSDVTATGAIAVGINADAPAGTASVYNYGSVSAYSNYDGATALGINAYGVDAYVNQSGSVYADAEGYDFAMASGVRVFGDVTATFYSSGGSTDAVANAYYSAIAEGAVVFAPTVYVDNGGDVSASASASGDTGSAVAIGIRALGDFAYFDNSGSIYAYASGYTGQALGALDYATNSLTAYNSGDIGAVGAGPYVNAVGIFVGSETGDASLYNSGSINASSDYWAIAVELETDTYGYIYNDGSIDASGGYHSIAIYSPGLSTDTIVNWGEITGSMWLGEGDDYLLNHAGGVWNAIEASYFGNGDDVIVNHGLIAMDDAVIDLGYHAVYGNGFYNYGTVSANGLDNVINMGSGLYTLVPSLNPNPFYNYGAITFQDGAADDMLTIVGDFAGDGDINVDVSGLNGVSDILYIDGSVVDGTVGTINVDLLDLPDSIETTVPMVYVSGDSVASNFVLGDVDWDAADSFVSLDFSLIADIDASNATPDVFSLGISVTGLSDAGTIAAAVPGVVQSLMNTQVGTWRQRMGVIDSFSDGAISLWARVFYDRGSFSPEHTFANFGAGGNFDYDEFNSGAEAGVDFAVTDEFSLGLLLSKSRGKGTLSDPGVGSAKVEADTWGVYGTWISPNGFYLDASYRWMSFDTTLESSFGVLEGDGDAEAFNIEVGYAWTLAGGLKIEPQLQYTRTNVDNLTVFQTGSGMSFTNDGGDSSRGRLGVSIRKSFGDADDSWMWTPYATLSAVREFDGENGFAVNDTFFGTTTVEGTSALLELGFTARHENWAIYGGLNWQDGGAVDSFFGGQLGVRYTFGGAAPAPAPVAPPPAKTCADLDDDGDGVNNCDDKCLGTAAGTAVGPDGCPVPAPEPEPVPEPKPFRG